MSFGRGGPGWGPEGSDTPDWGALAADAEATRARKRRWMLVGGGAVATVAVAAIVAVAVVAQGGGDASDSASSLPTPEDLPSSPSAPQPTFETEAPPPPPDPKDYITDPQKDTAPISAKTLYKTADVNSNGRTYKRRGTSSTTTCADATSGNLSSVLSANKCRELHRATFTSGEVAVTVGIAVFDSEAAAKKATAKAHPQLSPLTGTGVSSFCPATSACHVTANATGRYGYFTLGGFANGDNVASGDTAHSASRDIATYAYQQIQQRGEEQANHAATARPTDD